MKRYYFYGTIGIFLFIGLVITQAKTEKVLGKKKLPTPQLISQASLPLVEHNKMPLLPKEPTRDDGMDEKEKLFSQLQILFLQLAPEIIDTKKLTPILSKINAQGDRAVAFMLDELRSTPVSEAKLKTRMAIVDYFRYRMRWDKNIIEPLVAYIEDEVPTGINNKKKAIILADKAELLGGLAVVDKELARQIVFGISEPILRDIASYEIYHGLLQGNDTEDFALGFVHSFNPDFYL